MGERLGGKGGRGETYFSTLEGENSCHLSLQEKTPEYLTSQPEGRRGRKEVFLSTKGREEEGVDYLNGGEGRGEQGYLWHLPILPLLERSCSDCGRRWV